MNALKEYVTAIEAVLFLAFCAGLVWFGHHIAALSYEKDIAQANAATTTAVNAKERELRGVIDQLTADRAKEKADAKPKNDSLVADYRSGTKRVHVVIAARPPAVPSAGVEHTETHAELLPEAAASAIAVANDADDAVLDLNSCIDKYNAVKDELDPLRQGR